MSNAINHIKDLTCLPQSNGKLIKVIDKKVMLKSEIWRLNQSEAKVDGMEKNMYHDRDI